MIEELERTDELEAYKGKWGSVWFLSDGSIKRGEKIWPDREAVETAIQLWFNDPGDVLRGSTADFWGLERGTPADIVLTAFPIPVGDK